LTEETKSEETTETKLKRIAQRSKEDRRSEFKWLMQHVNAESLRNCYKELEGNKAVGINGQTKEEYGKNLEENIARLVEEMKIMAYRPGAVREVLIPKEGQKGKYRPLGISNFEDKMVQLMFSKILEAIYEPVFLDSSYGFRPGRSCHTAIKALYNYLYTNECEIIIDVDLKNFFGTINHEKLVEMLRERIKDEKFIRYIVRMLKAGVLSDGELKKTEEGSPQGSIASPILSNIYAHYVIDEWFAEVVKKAVQGKVEIFRYCDDMVICCRYQRDAERIKRALTKRLARYSLILNEEKTKMIRFSKQEQETGKQQGAFDFLGFTFYWGISRMGNTTVKVRTSRKRVKTKLKRVTEWVKKNRCHKKLKKMWSEFSIKLAGHIRYYGVSFNTKSIDRFFYQAKRIFFKWINRRSQRKSMNWEQFGAFMKKFPLPAIKVYHRLF